jgi:adenylate cyclase
VAIDFEAEGLLDGLEGEARKARLELVEWLTKEGFELDELKRAAAEGRLALLPVERVLEGEPCYTAAEVAERSGLDPERLENLWRALGVAEPQTEGRHFTDQHLRAAQHLKKGMDLGIPDDASLEVARVLSRGMASLADAVGPLLGDVFLQPGDTEADVAKRYAAVTRELVPLMGPLSENVYRMHQAQQVRRAAVGAEEIAAGHLPNSQVISVGFADLVGFTGLGERLPAAQLGAVARRLEELAVDAADPPVRLVKTIGDATMLVSPEPRPLLDTVLGLSERAEGEDDFPRVRAGVACGEALSSGGDWYGRPVNLASRITSFAKPSSVVATKDVRDAARDGYRWSFAGKRRFKGVKGDVAVYRVRRPD